MLPKVRPCGQSISPQFPEQLFGRAQKTDKDRFQIATTIRSFLSDFPARDMLDAYGLPQRVRRKTPNIA
jgi:hypothetical protein